MRAVATVELFKFKGIHINIKMSLVNLRTIKLKFDGHFVPPVFHAFMGHVKVLQQRNL